jgi:RNA-directed DNA polymerase
MEEKSQKRQVKSLEATEVEFGQYPEGTATCVIHRTSGEEKSVNNPSWLIEQIVSKGNMKEAYKRVVRNKGVPGVDGITTVELKGYLFKHWETTKQMLLEGRYHPQPVKRVEIPKPGGGVRKLGIPTVMDRLIQQAINQVLERFFEPVFSEYSYGFRPQRSAEMAIKQAKEYIREDRRYVVDMDLEKFFDKVNHDILIERIRRKVSEPEVLTLIRRYLKSGVMENGLVSINTEGTPQGGPLSPLLSNIMLDDLDKELERRGHKFCRYADDCNIYVKSEKAGKRVLESITKFIETKLKLKVNNDKSAVDKPWRRKFLGFSFTSLKKTTIRVHEKSLEKIRSKIKELCRIGRGMNMEMFIKKKLNPVVRGWGNYFKHADTVTYAKNLDKWIRKRLRIIMWRQWARPRVRYRKLAAAGVGPNECHMMANSSRGPCRMSNFHDYRKAYPPKYFEEMGLVSLFDIARKS